MSSAVDLFNKSKGLDFVRCLIATAAAGRGGMPIAADIASGRWGATSVPAQICKAAIASGSLIPSGDWGSDIAGVFRGAASEFFDSVMARSIVGQLTGRRNVPLKTRLVSIVSGASAYWTAQGQGKPTTKMEFSSDHLDPLKLIAQTIVTNELLQHSDARAENFIRGELMRALVELLDQSFIDPANAGVAGESPASVTSSGTVVPGSDDAATDLGNLFASFAGDLESAFLIMSGYAATAAHDAANQEIGARGGFYKGVPTIASASAGSTVALVDAAGIAIGEGAMEARTATSAAIQLDDAPTNDATTPTPTSLISLFQVNSVALLTEKIINWQVIRSGAVAYLSGATWPVGVSAT